MSIETLIAESLELLEIHRLNNKNPCFKMQVCSFVDANNATIFTHVLLSFQPAMRHQRSQECTVIEFEMKAEPHEDPREKFRRGLRNSYKYYANLAQMMLDDSDVD